MMISRTLLRLPLLATTAFVIGCSGGDAPTEPAAGSGSVSFNATGPAVSGAFNVSGAVQMGANQQVQPGNWAMGVRDGAELGVVAFRTRSGDRGDMMIIWADGVTGPRTVSVASEEAGFVFSTNVSLSGQMGGEHTCWLETGSVTITSISAQRAQGTFSGAGGCVSETSFDAVAFTVSGGQFNVPITTGFGTF
jgi:hypothetical protein